MGRVRVGTEVQYQGADNCHYLQKVVYIAENPAILT